MKHRKTGVGVALAVAGAAVGVLVFWRPAAVEAVYPVERFVRVFRQCVVSRLVGAVEGAGAARENVRLRRELAAAVLARDEAARTEAENVRLRQALGFVARNPVRWIAAGVLSSGGGAASARRTLRVDRGPLSGVGVGAAVVVPAGVVGLVTSVTPHTAEVTLVTDPAVRVACEVETERSGRPRGILCGGTDDLLALRHLSEARSASCGRRVFTSGLGGVFPSGLTVGTLLEVREDDEGLAHEGDVRPAVDFEVLEDVFIRHES